MKKIFLLISFLFLFGCEFFDKEITVYPVACNGTKDVNQMSNEELLDILRSEKACAGNLLPLNRRTYQVSRTRQDVMYWIPGVNELPSKLHKCIVRDSENWQCEGEIMEQGLLKNEYGVYYISKWRWWGLKLTGQDFLSGKFPSGKGGFWDSILFAVIFWGIIILGIILRLMTWNEKRKYKGEKPTRKDDEDA